jgi:hypothetical protein
MGLAQHVTPRIVIPLLEGNTVSLRGLNIDDFSALLVDHLEPVSKIAELYAVHKNSVFSNKAFQGFLIGIAKDFPLIVSEVISMSADEPEARDVKLSTGLQISCLTAIMKLTAEEAGGLGNLFAQLGALGRGVFATVADELGGTQAN